MDQIDIQLLELLQQDGRMTLSDLSKALNLSRPSITERLRRLEERNIIMGFAALVSPAGVGRGLLVFIEVGQVTVPCRKFEAFIATEPDVLECHRVTGAVSYIMKAAVSSVGHLEALVDRLIPYGRVNTSVVLSSPVTARTMIPPKSHP
ncbi:Lrp/AsnC family transcriptional regulator [Alicyclobacillus sp. ALC3]|uniref:Lrp/AsnC family transcriptional regulator n=1 Tax=Alicyclobacillus sp. ALC3 TaxID=2796143 RepID=UPI00237939F0|nr:Lrp/AsnC family transcriptional regulator [Alicyclobacillus sp. ALC3]WDL98387.1 Lrp/AsnC family transcriptional regulator [Alicyclobacillus sp. ALC3]